MEEKGSKTKTEEKGDKRGTGNGRLIIRCMHPSGWKDKPDTGGGPCDD